jgi:ABC-type uncharacterized transport system substrate-binding protein
MRRRDLIILLGGAAAWPLATWAQQDVRMRRVGVLLGTAEDDPVGQTRLEGFRQALAALGWSEGRNVRFEVRWSGGDLGLLRANAAELVALAPDVIIAGGTAVITALKPATRSIPLVFVDVNDPVAQGFVSSVARPGANITGFSYMDYSAVGKGIELLKKVVPTLTRVSFMFNPDTYPYYEAYLRSLLAAPLPFALEVTPSRVRSEGEVEKAIDTLAAAPGSGFILPPDPYIFAHRGLIIRLLAQNRLPAVWPSRDSVSEGGLMSYGPDRPDISRRVAAYVDRILKGEKPGDLPVQAPTKFQFVINLKTAKALGLDVPPMLLALTDEVIE